MLEFTCVPATHSEELRPYAVLMNAVLNTTFPETAFTRQMTVESRAKNLQKMLVAIVIAVSPLLPSDSPSCLAVLLMTCRNR